MKTEVYTWRLSSDLKARLEREARRRKTSVSAVLEEAANTCLERIEMDESDEEQRRLHEETGKYLGTIKGTDPRRSENVRSAVRTKLNRRYGR